MSEVNRLRREERELGLQAQELEIEDNLARCETINVNGNYKLIYVYITYICCTYYVFFNFFIFLKYKIIFFYLLFKKHNLIFLSFYKITDFGFNFNSLASIHRTNHLLVLLFPIYVLIVFCYFTFPK